MVLVCSCSYLSLHNWLLCYIKICIIFTNADDPCPSDRDHMNKLESIIRLCPSPPDVSSNSFGGQYIKHDPSLSISAN